MSETRVAPTATERVLPTLNTDGSRRWLRPKLSEGRWWTRRRAVAYGLIAAFTLIPYLRMNGKPLILLDIAHRRFTLFGQTFLPTDTMLLMLLLLGIFLSIFLFTAVFGRVWCGWACPQTVYLEYLYRPIGRWIEGGRERQVRSDRGAGGGRRILKYVVFVLLSMFLAHTFLAYFVGIETLGRWITGSPADHPFAFFVMAFVTALMFFDFAYFREQTCLVACPYGRFQSVLLDRDSLIVGYDPNRGEPRGKIRKGKLDREARERGDCIDCFKCVATCPTGIDIRDGLQMECVHCTQCIDACDSVMNKLGWPEGLIRYTSQRELAGERRRFLRPRVFVYGVIIATIFTALGVAVARTAPADVTVLRGLGTPFTVLPSGEVSNALRVKVQNRTEEQRSYTIELVDAEGMRLVAPRNPLPVPPDRSETAPMFVVAPADSFTGGEREITVRVSSEAGFETRERYLLLGPESR